MQQSNHEAFERLAVHYRLEAEQRMLLYRYLELIEEWNERINLVSRRDIAFLAEKHLADSLSWARLPIMPQSGGALDLGSGAGFPGIPLSILKPELQVLLLDSISKKASFLRTAVSALELKNAAVLCERAERLAGKRYKFDVITARAVAALERLWQWSRPLLKRGGFLAAQKGGDLSEELRLLKLSGNVEAEIIPLAPRANDQKVIVRVYCVD